MATSMGKKPLAVYAKLQCAPPHQPQGSDYSFPLDTLHRAPVGQGLLPPRSARAFGFWSLRALAKARRGRVYVYFIIIIQSFPLEKCEKQFEHAPSKSPMDFGSKTRKSLLLALSRRAGCKKNGGFAAQAAQNPGFCAIGYQLPPCADTDTTALQRHTPGSRKPRQ